MASTAVCEGREGGGEGWKRAEVGGGGGKQGKRRRRERGGERGQRKGEKQEMRGGTTPNLNNTQHVTPELPHNHDSSGDKGLTVASPCS